MERSQHSIAGDIVDLVRKLLSACIDQLSQKISGTLALMDLLFQLTRVGALLGRRIYVLGIRQHLTKIEIQATKLGELHFHNGNPLGTSCLPCSKKPNFSFREQSGRYFFASSLRGIPLIEVKSFVHPSALDDGAEWRRGHRKLGTAGWNHNKNY